MESKSTDGKSKIFEDEHHFCRIDFTSALWAETNLTKIYSDAKLNNILKSVDSIAEIITESKPSSEIAKATAENESMLILMEYKNFDNNRADKSELNDGEKRDILLSEVAKKYFDSLSFAVAKRQRSYNHKVYVWILDAAQGDKILREHIKKRLMKKLPFLLQKQQNLPKSLIDKLYVVDSKEWQQIFPSFPVYISLRRDGQFVPIENI